MPRFTQHNTEGYSEQDLKILNARYLEAVHILPEGAESADDLWVQSWEDHCAEKVLTDFDIKGERRMIIEDAIRVIKQAATALTPARNEEEQDALDECLIFLRNAGHEDAELN